MLIKIEDGKVKVKTEYNRDFIKKAHELQGKWESPYWTFPEDNEELVRDVLFNIYGEDGRVHESVTVQIDLDKFKYDRDIELGNIVIAKRLRKDSSVILNKNVVVVNGEFCRRGGTTTNPCVTFEQGTVLRVKDFPKELYEKVKDLPGVTLYTDAENNEKAKRAALEREREKILKRLEEINKQLEIL